MSRRLLWLPIRTWALAVRLAGAGVNAAVFSGCWTTRALERLFAAVLRHARLRRYVFSDHFSVDGALLEFR